MMRMSQHGHSNRDANLVNAINQGLSERNSLFAQRRSVVSVLSRENIIKAGSRGVYLFWIAEYLNGFFWAFCVGTILSLQTKCSFNRDAVFGTLNNGDAELARCILSTCLYVGAAFGSLMSAFIRLNTKRLYCIVFLEFISVLCFTLDVGFGWTSSLPGESGYLILFFWFEFKLKNKIHQK